MRFNTKTRYGMRAMVEIAKANQEAGIFMKDISKNQKISFKYLDHIIQSLKAAGLITNVKGKKSGYRLTRLPSKISSLEILKAFEAELVVNECLSEHIYCELEDVCHTYPFWEGLNIVINDYFSNATLQDLVEKKQFN